MDQTASGDDGFDWNKYGIGDNLNNRNLDTKNETFQIRDLFNQKNIGSTSKNLKVEIGAHDVLMIKLYK